MNRLRLELPKEIGGFNLKKITAAILSTLSLSLMGLFAPDVASADNRLNISLSSEAVFLGSAATVTISPSYLPDAANYNWGKFKYEVVAQKSSGFNAKADVYQSARQDCTGSFGTVSGVGQACSTSFTGQRTVFNGNLASSSTLSSMKLTQIDGPSQVLRVRAWIDRDNDDLLSPYELSTAQISITTVDPKKAKAFLDFEVRPPRFADGTISASIASGFAKYKASSLIDPSAIVMKVYGCNEISCEAVSGQAAYNNHPSLLRYEFSSAVKFQYQGTYTVQLVYRQSQDNEVVLATKTFDYTLQLPSGITTEVVKDNESTLSSGSSSATRAPRQRITNADTSIVDFEYKLTLKDKNPKFVSSRTVYFFVDIKDIKKPKDLLVDGLQIAQVSTPSGGVLTPSRDEIVLKRTTDANGLAVLRFSYLSPGPNERIEIDAEVNGIRPYEFAEPASEEVVVWEAAPPKTLDLYSSNNEGSSLSPVEITALALNSKGEPVTDGAVIFYADEGIQLDEVAPPLDDLGRSRTTLRISNHATKTGQGFIYGQILLPTGITTSKLAVSWTDYGRIFKVGGQPAEVIFRELTEVQINKTSTTITVSGLSLEDRVVFCKGTSCTGPIMKNINAKATRTWQRGKKTALYQVKINGVLVYSETHF